MRTIPLSLLALIVLGLSGVACSIGSDLVGNNPTKTSSNVLFQDDFAESTSGWSTLNEGSKFIAYDNGGLHFFVNDAKFDYWSTPGLKFSDVHIEVDVTKLAGPDDNDFGIICRYKDENNFYGMLISSDGYYGISKMKEGVHDVINSDGMQVSDIIRKGEATNRLQADCVGDVLRLSVNGEKLIEVKDPDFLSGDVGLVAGTFDEPGVDISFDNFIVTKP
jgi:hypothetical protein